MPATAHPYVVRRHRGVAQGIAAVAAAGCLALLPAARAQVPPMIPLVPGAEILVVPLLLVVIPLGMTLARSDEKTVREFERVHDWQGLAAFATRRMAEHPGDPHWQELRGRAWQRAGRCEQALPDLRPAFEWRQRTATPGDDGAFAAGLALGLCEVLAGEGARAEQTLTRLAALAPARWEPVYQLGAFAALRGDPTGLDERVATLERLQPSRAQALRDYAEAVMTSRHPPGDPVVRAEQAPEAPWATPGSETSLSSGRLAVGDRALQLPAGGWRLDATEPTVRWVRASRFSRQAKTDTVRLVTVRAIEQAEATRLDAAVAFTANPARAHGMKYWDGDEACAVRPALVIDRLDSSFDQPECLSVRVVDATAARASTGVGVALRGAEAAGARLAARAYEIHYSRFGLDWMVAATWWLPVPRVAGDLVALQWAHALAAQMRPLAEKPRAAPAPVPRLEAPLPGR